MYYLITSVPVLMAHGTYHYHEVGREHALHWLEEHHKELKVAQVTAQPGQLYQADLQFVQLLSKAIDRYLPTEQMPLPELQPQDEVLVVLRKPQPNAQPQGGGLGGFGGGGFGGGMVLGQVQTVDALSFATFKRGADHLSE